MVIDTSALIAILLDEPDFHKYLALIQKADRRLISAASLLEASMVLESRAGMAAGAELDLFIHDADIEVVPVDREHVDVARRAWRKYGKGNHPAALNFGDCFSYALAKVSGEQLLATGSDFQQTDLELC
ncbi:MAG: type II toxin-antitoxin system VapC family toxin [Alloacidobacterium sp.]|jgi:ribonuclease VapC